MLKGLFHEVDRHYNAEMDKLEEDAREFIEIREQMTEIVKEHISYENHREMEPPAESHRSILKNISSLFENYLRERE